MPFIRCVAYFMRAEQTVVPLDGDRSRTCCPLWVTPWRRPPYRLGHAMRAGLTFAALLLVVLIAGLGAELSGPLGRLPRLSIAEFFNEIRIPTALGITWSFCARECCSSK